jgi:hypothetical protein
MHGFGPIFGRKSKLRYELRSAFLPLFVFIGALLMVGYCWRYAVTIKPSRLPAREARPSVSEQTNPSLASVTQSFQSNSPAIPSADSKNATTH